MTQKRPPIIAVVGHIDHGKSRLQRALRNMDTELSEAGDITQHIGAYELHTRYEEAERKATIIDTPGHEAFSHIREHGLDLADLALVVVSSEEGWKPQTGEAYTLVQKMNIPHIFVFTKIDTEQSNLERAKQSVLREGVLLEGLGGSVPWIAVSSSVGTGISTLIELIFLTTDVYEIIEDRRDGSVGMLVEADIDPKVGIAGTVIVLRGSLEGNKYISVGGSVAPLRIMKTDRGTTISAAAPSTPVRVIGFDSVPPVGEPVFLHETKREAITAAKRWNELKGKQSRNNTIVNDTSREKAIPLVLRSDTASGLDSIEHAINAVAIEGISFTIIKKSVGTVTEEDVRLAGSQENGSVIGFHTEADARAKQLAERSATAVNLFPTIYEVIDWAESLTLKKKETYELSNPTGTATVIRIFEEQPAQHYAIIGAQMESGSFVRGQDILIRQNAAIGDRFTIESIEQKNRAVEEVSGMKTQFAMRIRGNGQVRLNDTILALPSIT